MGPGYNYENGIIKEYYFSDFEGHTLFSSSYDTKGKIASKSNEYFYFTSLKGSYNNQNGSYLFLYLLNPPQLKCTYKVIVKDTLGEIKYDVNVPTSRQVFLKPFLPNLGNGLSYWISLDVYDSASLQEENLLRRIN